MVGIAMITLPFGRENPQSWRCGISGKQSAVVVIASNWNGGEAMGKPYKLLIFDADGTLRRCTVSGQPCPNKAGEWELMPNVKKIMAEIDWSKTALGIASNQAGISLGYMDKQTAHQLLCDMVVEATGYFPPTGTIQVCPHGINDGCECRKPRPGMLDAIMQYWGEYQQNTIYIGDMESDKEAAESAGCDFMWARDFFGW